MESENRNGVSSTQKVKDLDKNNVTTPSKTKEEKNGKHEQIFLFRHSI